MKVTLPKDTDKRNIYIFAGIEPLYKRENGEWYKKIKRCNKCGKCCMNVDENWRFGVSEDGHCFNLVNYGTEFFCKLGSDRPFMCCIGEHLNPNECVIEWEKME